MEEVSTEKVLRCKTSTDANKLAGSIYSTYQANKGEDIYIRVIGAGALNQAVKAVAIARGFVAPAGVDLICFPAFAEVEVEGEDRTGIKLIVESRK